MHGSDSSHRQALEQAALRQGFRQRNLVEGELLGSPGAPRDSVFIVRNGRIRVYLASEDKEYTLTFLEAGDIYSTHSGAYLQALKPSEVLIGETAQMSRMLALPGAAATIIRVLGQTLANSMQLIEDLAFRDVEGRLARFLDGMLVRRGLSHESGVQRLELNLSTEDIAHLLGTTRQTVSSLISRLARQGILTRVAPGILDIHRPDLLKQRSQVSPG